MTISLTQGFKTPRAVVDWIELEVQLARNSHGGHLKNAYKGFGVSYVKPVNKGAGGAADHFLIRIQNPANYTPIRLLLDSLDADYGITTPTRLEAIEVSIDFFHEDTDVAALRAMTERLMFSIAPPTFGNPRVYGGNRADSLDGVLPSDRIRPIAGKTLYIGNKADDLMWRVYWKQTDDTHEDDGSRVVHQLPTDEWRARAEVRIQGDMLATLGLRLVADLRSFSYESLHSAGLFKFAKRDLTASPLFRNPHQAAQVGAHALGDDRSWPACAVNLFGRRDGRGRIRALSRVLVTDSELTEAARQALRGLTRRFGRTT
jgi:hypothetical protein